MHRVGVTVPRNEVSMCGGMKWGDVAIDGNQIEGIAVSNWVRENQSGKPPGVCTGESGSGSKKKTVVAAD